MRVIHKIELHPGLHTYRLTVGSKILTAQFQRGVMCLWFDRPVGAVDYEDRQILFTGTGHEFETKTWKYIATVQTDDQQFVFHVLEWVA